MKENKTENHVNALRAIAELIDRESYIVEEFDLVLDTDVFLILKAKKCEVRTRKQKHTPIS